MTETYRKLMLDVAELAVLHSGGRLRIAHNERDADTQADLEAAHFLKMDDRRLGRDLELYAFMMEMTGPPAAMCDMLGEVLIPIRAAGLDRSYQEAGGKLKTDGREYVPAGKHTAWNDLFA